MGQNKDIIFKLNKLIELRENTIIANKRAMKDYLVEYKKSLELDKELKKEQRLLREAISLLQYGFALEEEMKEDSCYSENNAPNRDLNIFTDDEE
tara:strand:+ start:278 stop:562 length:285 start_codon:yes stop_codon:yes gene_type:complete